MNATTQITAVPNNIASTEQTLRARGKARDGWLFIGLGLAVLAGAIGGVIAAESVETMTFMGVGLSAWTVLTGLGLYKFAAARQDGLRTAMTLIASIVIWPYALGVLIAGCSYFLPHFLFRAGFLGVDPIVLSWTVPVLVLAAVCLRIAFKSADPAVKHLRRGVCFMALSYLLLVYVLGLLGTMHWHWLVTGSLATDQQSPLLFGENRTLLFCAFALSLAFYGLTLRQLGALRREPPPPAAGSAAGWLLLAAWYYLVPVLVLGCCAVCKSASAYGGCVGVVFSLALAGTVGALAARVWRPDASRLRWWLVSVPLAAVLLLFLPLTAGTLIAPMGGEGWRYLYYDVNKLHSGAHEWMWYAPEALRAPLMRQLARISRMHETYIYSAGLSGTVDLKTESLSTAPKFAWGSTYISPVFAAWRDRDPADALAVSLAVAPAPLTVGTFTGPAPGTIVPSTSYDASAGYCVAQSGGDEEIRRRFAGNYSDAFISGLILGLGQSRHGQFGADIKQAFETRTMDWFCWQELGMHFPEEFEAIFRKLVQAPTPATAWRIQMMLRIEMFIQPKSYDELLGLALECSDPVVRFNSVQVLSHFGRNKRLSKANLKCVLACAEGALPGATGDEQRCAAWQLSQLVEPYVPFNLSPVNSYGAKTLKPSPLTASEVTAINGICKRAREYIDTMKGE